MANEKNKLEVTLALIDKATAPLQAFAKRVEAIQAPVRKVSNKLAILGEAAGIGKLRKAASGIGDAFGGVTDQVGKLVSVGQTLFASGGLFAGGLFGLVKMTSNAGDAFDELSTKAGVSASFFQKAGYAASFASVSNEDLAGALGKMNANIVAANTGSKEMAVWFKRAGITAQQLRKEKPEQIFQRVLDYVNTLPKDSAKAGALMRGIFGKSGANLLPMVDGFKELTEEAERLGLVLSDDTVKAGAKFNDTFDRLMKVVKGVGMMIGSILMPHFQEAIEFITAWTLANRELIATKVAEWVAELRKNWPEIKQGAMDALQALRDIFGFIQGAVGFVGGFANAIKLLAVAISIPLVVSLATATKAIIAFGIALMATPVGWFLAAIAAIAAAGYLIYKNWEPIKEWFSTLFDDPIKAIDVLMGKLMKLAEYIPGFGLVFKGINAITGAASGAGAPVGAAPVAAASGPMASTKTNNAAVSVDFKNMPRGVEVQPAANNTAPLDLGMGYAMATY